MMEANSTTQEMLFWAPLFMSLLAGGATGIGALAILLLGGLPQPRHMSFSLALAAGVMVSVSLVEMYIPLVMEDGIVAPTLATGCGAAVFLGILQLMPQPEQYMLPTHYKMMSPAHGGEKEGKSLRAKQWRLGMILMVTLTAHNLPEGLAVSVSELKDHSLGFVVTLAISLHNIPEGLAIAVPLYAATGSEYFAIGMAFLSGLSEPFGAWIALTFLRPYFISSPWMVSYVLAFVAGIMFAVSMTELIPEARTYEHPSSLIVGFIVGFIIILVTHAIQDGF